MRTWMLAIASLWLIVLPCDALSGAWTRPAGSVFLKLGFERWHTDERFDAGGHRVPFQAPEPGFADPSEYRALVFRTYAEYGLIDNLTLAVATSVEHMESEGGGSVREGGGLGDLHVSLRQRVAPGPVVISIQGEAKLPTGYDEQESPALGTGKPDFGGQLLVGGARGRTYVTAEGGYTFRGGDFADVVSAALEAGYALRPELSLRAEVRGRFTAAEPLRPLVAFDPAQVDARSITASLGLVLKGDPLDIVITADHMVDGENSLAGTRYGVSLWYER